MTSIAYAPVWRYFASDTTEWTRTCIVKMRAIQRCRSKNVECDQLVIQSKMLFLPPEQEKEWHQDIRNLSGATQHVSHDLIVDGRVPSIRLS